MTRKRYSCFLSITSMGKGFFVSATEVEGKIHYMYGLSEYDARIAGIHDLGYSGESELADRISEQLNS